VSGYDKLDTEELLQLCGRHDPSAREQLFARHRRQLRKMVLARMVPVLVLRYLEQLTIVQVATILGTSKGAVSMRQLRAIERIRTLLGEEP